LTSQHLFAGVLLLSLLNGIFSPFLFFVVYLSPVWMPDFALQSPSAVFYLSSLLLSTLTLLASGVPAALYERVTRASESTVASLSIWLVCAGMLSFPGLVRAFVVLTGGAG
jgi:hypothetical protein